MADVPAFPELADSMVASQLMARGIEDAAVLDAMRKVPRHRFVPAEWQAEAYEDRPLPLEAGQTISQPYIVARMSELLEVRRGDRILEVGTGSGYQAAVLAQMGAWVFSIEAVESLARTAQERLRELGYARVTVRAGNGWDGWPQEAPFDGILFTASAPRPPSHLEEQMRIGAHLVVPVGGPADVQVLWRFTRQKDGLHGERLFEVRFVPVTGA